MRVTLAAASKRVQLFLCVVSFAFLCYAVECCLAQVLARSHCPPLAQFGRAVRHPTAYSTAPKTQTILACTRHAGRAGGCHRPPLQVPCLEASPFHTATITFVCPQSLFFGNNINDDLGHFWERVHFAGRGVGRHFTSFWLRAAWHNVRI